MSASTAQGIQKYLPGNYFSNNELWTIFPSILLVTLCVVISLKTELYALLALPFLLLMAVQIIGKPITAFYLLILSVPFTTNIHIGGIAIQFFSEPMMILWLCLGFVYYVLYKRNVGQDIAILHPISTILIASLLWCLISGITSQEPLLSAKYIATRVWTLGGMYAVLLYFIKEKVTMKRTLWILALSLTLISGVIMLRHGLQGFSFDSINFVLNPFFSNHVEYASTLVLLLPFLIMARTWYPKRSLKRHVCTALAIFFALAIILSYTRAAILIMALYLPIYFILKWKLSKHAMLLTAILSLLFFVRFVKNEAFLPFAPNYETTISHDEFGNLLEATYNMEDISTMERIHRWVAGYYMFKDKPVFGFGPNTFYEEYDVYALTKFKTYVSDNPDKSTIHNQFFLLLIEQGIPGVLLFLALLITALLYCEKLVHSSFVKGYESSLLYASGMSLIGLILLSCMNDFIGLDKIEFIFFLSLACIVTIHCKYLKSIT